MSLFSNRSRVITMKCWRKNYYFDPFLDSPSCQAPAEKPSKTITKAYQNLNRKIMSLSDGNFLFFPFFLFDSFHRVLFHCPKVHLDPVTNRLLQSFLLRFGVFRRHL